jgi:hypothetical protein
MQPRLFLQLTRERGLTWETSPPDGRRGAHGAVTDAAIRAVVADIASVGIVVSWNASAVYGSIASAAKRLGIAEIAPVELVELRRLSTPAGVRDAGPPLIPLPDAAAVAAAYASGAYSRAILPAAAEPSAEQRRILFAFERGRNIVCRAVYGAGKTTTLLLCAARRPGAACLLLTYNKGLQLDVARRAQRAAPNMTVATYHSAAGRAYGCVVQNDEVFRAVVRAAPPSPPAFDVLLLDEAQDMSIEYYAFVRWLLAARPDAQLVVVGDERQAINEYRGSRAEFLTEAARIYAAPRSAWEECTLSVSHRLTPATAAFLNRHLLGGLPVVVGGNRREPNEPPRYVAARTKADLVAALAAQVRDAAATYGPAGVFVLAPSVRNMTGSVSPLAELVRRHLAGIPTYVAGTDEGRVDADLIAGKLAILSFNASKGRERPCAILVGFDEGYFDYYDRAWAAERSVPNVLAVAASRASARLVIVATSWRTLRTVDRQALDATATIVGTKPSAPKIRDRPARKVRPVSVTDLVRHLHPETVAAALRLVDVGPPLADVRARVAALPPAVLPATKVRFGDLYEDLSFAYGIVAPVLAELERTGTSGFGAGLDAPTIVAAPADVRPLSADITAAEHAAYPEDFWEDVTSAALTEPADRTLVDWMRLAVARHAMEGGHHHVARQVADYGWIDGAALRAARDAILGALRGIGGEFEVMLPEAPVGDVVVMGRADFVADDGTVWEFKSCGVYREEHALQLACYIALRGGGKGVLFTGCTVHGVTVARADAAPLLAALADKVREPTVDIFSLIDAFDRGVDEPAPAAGFGVETANPNGTVTVDLDDMY